MDTIDENLGEFIPQSPFKKKTLFYILFATIYDICYGINSELVTKNHNKVTVHHINILRHIGEDLEQSRADIKILEAATRRTTNPHERKILFKYFKTRIDG